MYQAIHHSLEKGVACEDLQGPLEGTNLPGDACLVLTTDPKPRLRWTAELHERFVDAVTQLGGPDSKFRSPLLFCLDSGKMSLAFVFFGAVGRGIQVEGCTVAIADTDAAQDPGGRGNGGAFGPFPGDFVSYSLFFTVIAEATPKTIMRTMGVKGLTLYHLKSHLQKYRLGKQSCKELSDGSKDAAGLSETQGNSSRMMSQEIKDGFQVTEALRVQMEVQRRLHEQLEVQRHLQLRIEAQGKYLQSILEKACRVLADQNMASSGLETARQELSELAIKVSGDCLTAPCDTTNLASLTGMAAVCLDDKSINRQTQITDCSVDSCLTSNDSSGKVSADIGLQAGGKKRTRPLYPTSDSLVWESDVRQDVQWMTSF
ncbi:Myb family transcription factor [Nymphaea thermarum]|nr:Myb family transcription factor [Nymphaea thermarum]